MLYSDMRPFLIAVYLLFETHAVAGNLSRAGMYLGGGAMRTGRKRL